MLTDKSPGVPAVGSGFGPETGGIGRKFNGQFFLVKDFITVNIGQGNFRCGNHEVITIFKFEQILFKLGQLTGAGEAFSADNKGGQHLGVAMFIDVDVQHEVDQSAFQPGTGTQIQGKSGTGDLGGPCKI